jgi:hypothetical protein
VVGISLSTFPGDTKVCSSIKALGKTKKGKHTKKARTNELEQREAYVCGKSKLCAYGIMCIICRYVNRGTWILMKGYKLKLA